MFLFPTKCCITRVYKRELNKSPASVSFISIDTVNIFASPTTFIPIFLVCKKKKKKVLIFSGKYVSRLESCHVTIQTLLDLFLRFLF